jgi:hypothetical protein
MVLDSGKQRSSFLQMAPIGVMHSSSRRKLYSILAVTFLLLFWLRSPIAVALSIFSLPVTWKLKSPSFLISQQLDGFDLTFVNYSTTRVTSLPEHPDLVPPVLHHIALGHNPDSEQADWSTAKNNCLAYHPDWEAHLWTDQKAATFINEKFPLLKPMWDGYKYPIQRVDALRHQGWSEFAHQPTISRTNDFLNTKK